MHLKESPPLLHPRFFSPSNSSSELESVPRLPRFSEKSRIRRTIKIEEILAFFKIYLSESRNRLSMESIERAALIFLEVVIVDQFQMEFVRVPSSRTRFSLCLLYRILPKHHLIYKYSSSVHLSGLTPQETMKSLLACCKIYISESRNRLSLESIERAAKIFPDVVIVNKFTDDVYNRVGYTLVSNIPDESASVTNPLKNAIFDMVKEAFRTINLQDHSGGHPRLGVVDHVCFHPLSMASLDQVAAVARSVAVDIGENLQVPTYLYGAAHKEGRTLDSLRRELGYFKPNSPSNKWTGSLELQALTPQPDAGPPKASKSMGIIVIGATRWVDNYNVPINSTDIGVVKRIARLVSGRGGGLESVQAMALIHGEKSTEVACNLLDHEKVNADQVQIRVEELATQEGLTAGKGYYTDFSRETIIDRYLSSKNVKI